MFSQKEDIGVITCLIYCKHCGTKTYCGRKIYIDCNSTISNGKKTSYRPIRSAIIRVITKSEWQESDLFVTSMTTDRIERRKVLLPINNKNYNFREKKRSRVFLKFYLVDLNNNFECDWLTELFYNNSTSELVENRSFLNQSQSKKL